MEKEIGDLNREIRAAAVKNGLCAMWQKDWLQDWSMEKMIKKFYEGIDFFFSTRFISPDFIRNNFEQGFLRSHGLIANDTYSLHNPRIAVIIGDSSSNIRINGDKASVVYVADNSSVSVKARQMSFVIIHALDNAKVTTEAFDNAHVKIINHSRSTTIQADANTRVADEFDWPDKA